MWKNSNDIVAVVLLGESPVTGGKNLIISNIRRGLSSNFFAWSTKLNFHLIQMLLLDWIYCAINTSENLGTILVSSRSTVHPFVLFIYHLEQIGIGN